MKRVARFYSSGTYYYIYALGSGIDTGTANALTVFNNELYVGGRFPAVGGITVNNIARWNGSNWNLVATGVNDSVCSLYSYNSVLYAGGTFTAAGATIANRIARWTGNSWTSMSTGMSGMNPCVKSIFPWQNIVFAAGMFSSAGGVPVNNIAGWGTFPAAPSLIYPPDAASGIPVNLTFTWNSVPYAASYALQVARDPNFNNIVVNAVSLTNPQYQVLPGVLDYDNTYFWKVNARNGLGIGPWSLIRFFRTSLVGIIDPGVIPLEFKLYQNYPNPFNPSTIIRFDLPVTNDKNAHVDLVLYDLLGKEVAVLYSNDYAGGKYEITIDADKINMSSGVYFVKLTAGGRSAINRIMLVK
jgi:hypothetical protein